MSETEEWRPVVSRGEHFPGYEVSNLGRVRSFWKKTGYGNRIGIPPFICDVPRLLKTSRNGNGYSSVVFYKDGKRHSRVVHQLVLEAFVGPRPAGLVACHGPNGKEDNSVSNLSWDTSEKNMADRVRDGTDMKGEDSPRAKLTEEEVIEIRNLLSQGVRQIDVASKFNVARSTLYYIKYGKSWSHLDK